MNLIERTVQGVRNRLACIQVWAAYRRSADNPISLHTKAMRKDLKTHRLPTALSQTCMQNGKNFISLFCPLSGC